MKMSHKNKKFLVKHGILLGLLVIYLAILLISFYKGELLHVHPGFTITKNDGRQFDSMSNFIHENKKLYPAYYDSDHSSQFYMGYTLLVATIKGLFGKHWQIAYTLLHGLLLYLLVLLASRVFSQKNNYLLVFLISIVFVIANRYLNNYSRNLLPDVIFAIGTGFTFIWIVSGIAKNKRKPLLTAILIALIMMFIRPNGVFLVIFSVILFFSTFLPKRYRKMSVLATPLLTGLLIFIFSIGLTAWLAKNIDKLETYPETPRRVFSKILEINYLGNNMVHKNHIGTLIVNFPYQYWIYNEGSFAEILSSTLKRVPRVFEISIPVYNNFHNFIRYLYYVPLYLFFLAFLIYSFLVKSTHPQYLLMGSLIFGYLFAFISQSHIEVRYILTFDVCIILCSSFMVYKTIGFIFSKRKKNLPCENS